MIADWFASPEPGNPMWAPVIDVIARVTILYLLACATHCILGRRRALVRSALWNSVLLAAILQSAAALGLPRLRIACLSAEEVTRSRASWPTCFAVTISGTCCSRSSKSSTGRIPWFG
jgi:hypothetical protein